MSHEPMHRIIRVKRYETPPAGYLENFLREFQHRQRAELLKPSISALILDRIASLFQDIRVPAMAYAGAAVLAVVTSIAIIGHTASPGNQSKAYAGTVSYPVTIEKMQPVSLRANLPSGSGPSVFPSSFLLKARPASHESPLSF
jgi:hypothetical protein